MGTILFATASPVVRIVFFSTVVHAAGQREAVWCRSLLTGALLPDTGRTVTLLQTGEGAGFDVETVLIPVVRSQGRRPRTTLCISSQVGCAMNCQFCFTGRMGLK